MFVFVFLLGVFVRVSECVCLSVCFCNVLCDLCVCVFCVFVFVLLVCVINFF